MKEYILFFQKVVCLFIYVMICGKYWLHLIWYIQFSKDRKLIFLSLDHHTLSWLCSLSPFLSLIVSYLTLFITKLLDVTEENQNNYRLKIRLNQIINKQILENKVNKNEDFKGISKIIQILIIHQMMKKIKVLLKNEHF